MFRNMAIFLRWGVVSTSPNPQDGGPPLVSCPRMLIQSIHSYTPYPEAVPPSATWGRGMPRWQGPTYRGDRDWLIVVRGTDLSWWEGPTYRGDRDRLIVVRGTDLTWWQGPTYRGERDRLIVVTGTDLSWWQGPTYHNFLNYANCSSEIWELSKQIGTSVCTYVCVCIYVRMYASMYACLYACFYVCVCM
jgi:hypothetical protein